MAEMANPKPLTPNATTADSTRPRFSALIPAAQRADDTQARGGWLDVLELRVAVARGGWLCRALPARSDLEKTGRVAKLLE
mmetsp:Transcript_23159/g.57299  ORF Transcript_23159/g.57299 Transcript_23159/m.57299 type:complete len:81 (+) Transcript_23159:2163-2405(+)